MAINSPDAEIAFTNRAVGTTEKGEVRKSRPLRICPSVMESTSVEGMFGNSWAAGIKTSAKRPEADSSASCSSVLAMLRSNSPEAVRRRQVK